MAAAKEPYRRPYKTYISLSPELKDALDAQAEGFDLSTAAYAQALLTGAIKSGRAGEMALAGMPTISRHNTRSRPRPYLRHWKSSGGDVSQPNPADWSSGAYVMKRTGDHKRARRPDPGDGWYLYGPGFEKGEFLHLRRPEAVLRAEELIHFHESE